jgi:hypothetical protein
MRLLLPRIGLAVAAVLLIAWFAVLLRNERTGSYAQLRLHSDPEMSDRDWAHFIDRLRQAELLNPGSKWRVKRAAFLLLRDRRDALRVADSVLRREPDNLGAWKVVRNAARGVDARRSAQADAAIERLSPITARGP